MRILYHHRIRSTDGQYVHLDELIRALRALGHELRIVGPSATTRQPLGRESQWLAWLKRGVPRWAYELLEFSYCFFDWVRLAWAVLHHKPDLIYERFNLFLPSGVWASKAFGVPLFLEVNAPLYQERARYDGIALHSLARWTQEQTWRGATKCMPVTRVLAPYLIEAGVPSSDITVIPNGIDESSFLTAGLRRGDSGLLPVAMRGSLILGFVGFVRSWHGIDKIVSLIADTELSEQRLSLLVVGDGPARRSLEGQARALGVTERVHFTGTVQRDEINAYLELFDIALQPTVVSYASPLKLFEYLATGRAIVAPDAANIREVLSDGYNALLFDPDDDESMRRSIIRLAGDAPLRRRLGENAERTIAQGGYTWRQNAETITRLFNGLERETATRVADR